MHVKKHLWISLLSSTCVLFSACGGGGGGSGSGSGSGSAPTPGSSSGSIPASTTMNSDGTARTVNTNCPFTQTIAPARNDGLRIERVNWLQTVALDPGQSDTRLAGAKTVKVRVDLLADNVRGAPTVKELRVYDPSNNSCTSYPLSGPNSVPTAITLDSLSNAYVATIPASKIKPGMGVSVVIDDVSGRSVSEADATYRYYLPAVAAAQTETVRLIPLRILGTTATVSGANIGEVLTRLHPISVANVTTTPALNILSVTVNNLISSGIASLSLMTAVLDEVDDYCAQLNGSQRSARTAPKCIAFFPDTIIFRPSSGSGQVVGLAYVGGISLLTQQVLNTDDNTVTSPYASRHWMNYRALTLAHEYGHILNLDHAACGGATGVDPRLYGDGRLNNGAGWDEVRDIHFSSTRLDGSNQPQFADLMSYCGKEWSSDRGYLAAMGYRSASNEGAARIAESTEQWLKISQVNGVWKIRPAAFAPSTLKLSSLELVVSSDQPPETLPLYSAVVSDMPELNQGPYYVDLGSRQVTQVQVLRAGEQLKSWSGHEIPAR